MEFLYMMVLNWDTRSNLPSGTTTTGSYLLCKWQPSPTNRQPRRNLVRVISRQPERLHFPCNDRLPIMYDDLTHERAAFDIRLY